MISNEEFLEHVKSGKSFEPNTPLMEKLNDLSQEALKITSELNSRYHTPKEVVEAFSKLTDKKVDESFRMFPPFHTDCAINIKVGKNVFINAGCKFQDQGGIELGDEVLIGHNVVIATLNHDLDPLKRGVLHHKKVTIGSRVWVGSNSTILQGVHVGEGAVVGAGSVVTKDVPPNCVVVGNPARVVKAI